MPVSPCNRIISTSSIIFCIVNKMPSNNIHQHFFIGEAIRKRIDELHISHAEFARQIGCARTSLYRIFNAKSIDIERLILISKILDFDFIHTYYIENNNVPEPQQPTPSLVIPWIDGKLHLEHLPSELKTVLLEHLLNDKA